MGLSALLPKTLLENHEHAVTLMQQVSDAALSTLQASHPLEELPARLWAEHSALAGVPRDSASRQHQVSAFPFCTENLGQTQPLPSQPQDQKRRTITRNWISFTPPPLLPRSLRFPQHCTPLRARRAWLSPAPHSYEVLPAAHTSTWKPHRRPEPFYRQFSLLFFPWLHKDKKKLRY